MEEHLTKRKLQSLEFDERLLDLVEGKPTRLPPRHSGASKASDTDPDIAYSEALPQSVFDKLDTDEFTDVTKEKPDGHFRCVLISDTHNKEAQIPPEWIPPCDFLFHAGDITNVGEPSQLAAFSDWLGTLTQCRHKVVIAGNHDLTLDKAYRPKLFNLFHRNRRIDGVSCENEPVFDPLEVRKNIKNCVYLEDETVQIEGLFIHGSPWSPWFYEWGFNAKRGQECQELMCDPIPTGVHVVLTHGPALGHGDLLRHGGRAGCANLLRTLEHRVRPLLHVAGHIHEDHGVSTNRTTLFVNASTCSLRYRPVQRPIIVDIPKPSLHHE